MKKILKNNSNALLDKFNSSIMFDKRLYKEDIKGSIAHCNMLHKQKIITKDELEQITKGLKQILQEINEGKFEFKLSDEDIHMAIESRLTDIIGKSAKKMHTSRSRNDQVATDMALYLKKQNKKIAKKLKKLIGVFYEQAINSTDAILPGFTHLQHAQPITFSFFLLAYMNMFKRDYDRFKSNIKRNNTCPLGSGALAGVPYDIDRELSASLLDFKAPSANALDSVSNRDFSLDALYAISTLMMHISKLSEELIIYSSFEFDFIKMSNDYCTTSSIMPQKINPDVAELLRGKSGRVYGNLISLLTTLKGLPLAYNKDMQEDKEGVFDSIDTANISLDILIELIKTMKINKKQMRQACEVGHLSATDGADYLVSNEGFSFRDAYYAIKSLTAYANTINKDASKLNIKEVRKSCEELKDVKEDILDAFKIEQCVAKRNSYGGTSPKQCTIALEEFKKWLKEQK